MGVKLVGSQLFVEQDLLSEEQIKDIAPKHTGKYNVNHGKRWHVR